MSTAPTELDEATKSRLAYEAEQLVRMGMEKREARRIVWDDYLAELATVVTVTSTPVEEPEPPPAAPEVDVPDTPVPVPPPAFRQRFWDAKQETPLTPERLQKNRAELAKVKRLIGLRT